tara:strand:+ start:288 stop:677 length:390 start_codon:yes stop_codon:yes gene_type:complete
MDKPPLSPYGAFIGISIDDFSEGKVTCSVALRDHHLNNGGRVHGGVLTSLADTAAGAAVRTVRPEGKLTATTDLSISFLRPPVGNQLVAVAEVLHAGKRLFRVEIQIFCLEKLVAKTNATFMLVEKSKY